MLEWEKLILFFEYGLNSTGGRQIPCTELSKEHWHWLPSSYQQTRTMQSESKIDGFPANKDFSALLHEG